MKKETQVIYATNKRVPDLVRKFIEEGVQSPFLTKEALSSFENGAIKFVRAKKGSEEIITPLYHEHRQLKIHHFKYKVYSRRVVDVNELENGVHWTKKVYNFVKNIKWYGIR